MVTSVGDGRDQSWYASPMGRTIPPEQAFARTRYADPTLAQRRAILRETVAAFEAAEPPDRYHRLAAANLERWREAATPTPARQIEVVAGDWGEVTARETRRFGVCFAALNMANAYVPGGAYVEGTVAQEENMFRRTDCHLAVDASEFDPQTERYTRAMSDRINAKAGRVPLDTERPRVCIRGPEDRTREDLGYAWLADDEVFPFYELRAAAVDLRTGGVFDPDEARARIDAQLHTLIDAGVRHAILSAFGCGAFHNPARRVATIYAEALRAQESSFDRVVFAIFHAGYGPDNFTPFAEVFAE